MTNKSKTIINMIYYISVERTLTSSNHTCGKTSERDVCDPGNFPLKYFQFFFFFFEFVGVRIINITKPDLLHIIKEMIDIVWFDVVFSTKAAVLVVELCVAFNVSLRNSRFYA